MVKKVGIVSFWRNNYGSALQCYATKKTLEKMGYRGVVLNERYKGIKRYLNFLFKKIKIIGQSIRHPSFIFYNRRIKKARKKMTGNLSRKASKKIELFVQKELQPVECSWSELKKIGNNKRFQTFLAGSDQIWNMSGGMINPLYFLEFTIPNKRIAFAPSFGTDKVPKFIRSKLKKKLENFEVLSVREKQGNEIINNLLGDYTKQLADPAFLLTASEWRMLYQNKSRKKCNNYILIHFLDRPSCVAINTIKKMLSDDGYSVICFSNEYSEFSFIEEMEIIEGDPLDYIYYIDNASHVCTDSFHSAVFSIIFDTPFFVFERQYYCIEKQSSRIDSLLEVFGCQECKIIEEMTAEEMRKIKKGDYEKLREEQREALLTFLTNAIDGVSEVVKNESECLSLKEEDECTGCGVCVEVCPFDAIQLTTNAKGYCIPQINYEKCYRCGVCDEYCKKVYSRIDGLKKKKAYIAYNINDSIRSKSASGGMFSAVAEAILKEGGAVVGAKMEFVNGKPQIEHVMIENIEELVGLLGSKYVQSNCSKSFPLVKKTLETKKPVLFCGTSCQIDALYRYLSGKEYENLYTVDLICHGVPGQDFFCEYVKYLEAKYRGKIIDFNFRLKTEKGIEYVENFVIESGNSRRTIYIPAKKSAYYFLFLSGESYRDNCYECMYASLSKPSDITVGDYFECEEDCSEIYEQNQLSRLDGISCLIVHSAKGEKAINKSNIVKYEISIEQAQESHYQLRQPMMYTDMREKIFQRYRKGGYKAVQRYIDMRNCMFELPRRIFSLTSTK